MSNYYRNILTPDLYEFLSSNKSLYGDAVLSQFNDASELISLSTEEDESLAVVLSGESRGSGVSNSYVENDVERIVFQSDGITRKKIKFRSIESQTYSQNLIDFTSHLASPFVKGISEAEKQSRISRHPSAYTLVSDFEDKALNFGCLVIIRKIGETFFIVSNVSAPNVNYTQGNNTGDDGGSKNGFDLGTPKDKAIEDKYGLKRTKGKYTGILTQYRDTVFYNGSLPKGLLRVPDTAHWTLYGSGDGSVLADYVTSVNEMAKAFHKEFKKKMRASGIRSFQQQFINRSESVRKGNCKSVTTRGCTTAIPGTSHHGWGQAIDVRKPKGIACGKNNKACFIKYDKYHDWLLENAYKIGFAGIKWGWLGMKGVPVMATKKLKEPWHWEPITGRVMDL